MSGRIEQGTIPNNSKSFKKKWTQAKLKYKKDTNSQARKSPQARNERPLLYE